MRNCRRRRDGFRFFPGNRGDRFIQPVLEEAPPPRIDPTSSANGRKSVAPFARIKHQYLDICQSTRPEHCVHCVHRFAEAVAPASRAVIALAVRNPQFARTCQPGTNQVVKTQGMQAGQHPVTNRCGNTITSGKQARFALHGRIAVAADGPLRAGRCAQAATIAPRGIKGDFAIGKLDCAMRTGLAATSTRGIGQMRMDAEIAVNVGRRQRFGGTLGPQPPKQEATDHFSQIPPYTVGPRPGTKAIGLTAGAGTGFMRSSISSWLGRGSPSDVARRSRNSSHQAPVSIARPA